VTAYQRALNLNEAVATMRYSVGEVQFERTAFVSAPDQAIISAFVKGVLR
jgi:hypothetical protein